MAQQSPKRRVPRPARKQPRKQAKSSSTSTAATPPTKLDAIVTALRAPKGATLAQLATLTGWQPHSVRGAMSGALKKQRGLAISSTKSNGDRIYRIGAGK